MSETGLLIAEIVFLVLLFGIIASIVGSAGRQLGRAQLPPQPRPDPVVDPPRVRPVVVHAPAPEPIAASEPAPIAPAPDLSQAPTVLPGPALDVGRSDEPTDGAGAEPEQEPAPAEHTAGQDTQAIEMVDEAGVPFDIVAAGGRAADRPSLDLTANITPRLVVEGSDRLEVGSELELESGLTIGRSGAADLSLADHYVSHMHARILRRGPYYFVEDLGSTNGTFLNDRRIEGSAQLKVHDTLRMGQTILRYEE